MSEQHSKPEERREDPGDLEKVKELLRFLEKSRPGDHDNQMSDLIEAVCVLGVRWAKAGTPQAVFAGVIAELIEQYPGYGDTAEYYDTTTTWTPIVTNTSVN